MYFIFFLSINMKYFLTVAQNMCTEKIVNGRFYILKERERSSAFKAIGLIAIAVRQDVEKHRGPVFEQVKVLLPMKDLGHK